MKCYVEGEVYRELCDFEPIKKLIEIDGVFYEPCGKKAYEVVKDKDLELLKNKKSNMSQKIVSFKVAKVIKEAGYPQNHNIGDSWCYENGQYPDESECETPPLKGCYILLPTYIDVWFWLWREKGIRILPTGGIIFMGKGKLDSKNLWNRPDDPEEVIIAAIDYLVDNDLIK